MILKDIYKIIGKYLSGKESVEERRQLYKWYDNYNDSKNLKSHPDPNITEEIRKQLFNEIRRGKRTSTKIRVLTITISAAAVLLIVNFFWQYRKQSDNLTPLNKNKLAVIKPKVTSADFKCSDGTFYSIGNIRNNDTLAIGGLLLVKKDVENIELINNNSNIERGNLSYTLSTYPGGICGVLLPDGSKVIVQVGSEITFTDLFFKKDRKVKLEGEAFFDVVKNKGRFIVETGNQIVEVLGTRFNIENNKSENEIKTSLIEGTVKILNRNNISKNLAILKPGERGVFKNNYLKVSPTDTSSIAEWTKGFFVFDNGNLRSTFDKIAKWYGIEVTYKGNINTIKYDGKIPNTLSLAQLIESLNYAEIPSQTFLNSEGDIVLMIGK
jgi:hypothetical protein